MVNIPKLIIADDHIMFLEGLRAILERDQKYKVVCAATSGENVIKYLDINKDKTIDLVLTDLSMPDMDGIKLNKLIRTNYPNVKTLVVSMHKDEDIIHSLITDHVGGYITKDDTSNTKLFTAIDTILSGKTYFSDKIWKTYTQSKIKKQKELLNNLSDIEKEILQLIASEFTTREIADKVNRSKLTIDSYRKNLLAKLEVRNSVGLTKWAIKVGLVEL